MSEIRASRQTGTLPLARVPGGHVFTVAPWHSGNCRKQVIGTDSRLVVDGESAIHLAADRLRRERLRIPTHVRSFRGAVESLLTLLNPEVPACARGGTRNRRMGYGRFSEGVGEPTRGAKMPFAAKASLVVVVVLTIRLFGIANSYSGAPVGSTEIIAITCEQKGLFSRGYAWALKVDNEGRAILTVRKAPRESVRRFSLRERLPLIEKQLATQRFFDLPSEIGRLVSDGGTRVLTVKTRNREKTITIRYVDGPLMDEKAARAMRVWEVVRGSFEEKAAVDARPSDREVMKSMGK